MGLFAFTWWALEVKIEGFFFFIRDVKLKRAKSNQTRESAPGKQKKTKEESVNIKRAVVSIGIVFNLFFIFYCGSVD